MSPARAALVVGLGFVGRAFARALVARGYSVRATSRDPAGCAPEPGVTLERLARGAPPPELRGLDVLLSTVPPDVEGDPALDLLEAGLRAAPPAWLGYLSSTGVYGDHGGAVVTEASETRPSSDHARRRLAAETRWRALPGVHIFRLGGIYGPGRSALDEVRAGRARRVVKPGHRTARIHVDDAVGALLASLDRPRPGAVYNVVDDAPSASDEVVALACELLGAPLPPEVPWTDPSVSPMARSFLQDERRVSNARLHEELGLALRHPDAASGLRAILEGP